VNFDFPPHHEDYVHRIGRTGRAKSLGEAISFITREDESALRALERFTRRGIPRREAEGFDLKAPPSKGHGQETGRRQPRRPGEVRGSRSREDSSGSQSSSRRSGSKAFAKGKPRNLRMSGEPEKKSPEGQSKKKGFGRFLGFGRRG
jgi:ATP-dependent RNA helicase RhlE